MRVLVGDIGGTKTSLAIAEIAGDRVGLSEERRYPSRDFASLEEILIRYRAETGVSCDLGGFAVAGPVHDDCSRITNLPWQIDVRRLERTTGLGSARLLNDLEAVAWAIPALGEGELAVLQAGEPEARGNACVVAAGTGLGEAGLYWDGRRHHPFATEGGHSDFAPSDEREVALLRFLQRCYGRVSWERVVSGMGIGDIFRFLLEWRGGEPPAGVAAAVRDGDPAGAIAVAAISGACPLCHETMELFAALYGREAGNMALKHLALGGVYLGGGIAPKNLVLLERPCFIEAFLAKGRMEPLMRRMPVRVILEQRAPLLGAARFMITR
jgi:glucokinase